MYYIIISRPNKGLDPFPLKQLSWQVVLSSYFIKLGLFSHMTDVKSNNYNIMLVSRRIVTTTNEHFLSLKWWGHPRRCPMTKIYSLDK